jgi:hypothetical protein
MHARIRTKCKLTLYVCMQTCNACMHILQPLAPACMLSHPLHTFFLFYMHHLAFVVFFHSTYPDHPYLHCHVLGHIVMYVCSYTRSIGVSIQV